MIIILRYDLQVFCLYMCMPFEKKHSTLNLDLKGYENQPHRLRLSKIYLRNSTIDLGKDYHLRRGMERERQTTNLPLISKVLRIHHKLVFSKIFLKEFYNRLGERQFTWGEGWEEKR